MSASAARVRARRGEHVALDVCRDQGHVRPAIGGGERHRDALPPARAVADVAHRIDRFARAPGAHDDPQPGEVVPAREQRRDERVQLLGLAHAAGPDIAAGERTVFGTDDVHPPAA